MLTREENELLTPRRAGRPDGQDAAPLLAAGAARAPSSRPTARPSACGCWARISSRFATPTAASGCSTRTARTAAPRSSSRATRQCGLRCLYHGWKIGRRRPRPRDAARARRAQLQRQGSRAGIPGARSRRVRVGVPRAAGTEPPFTGLRVHARSRCEHVLLDERDRELQLGAGDRGRDRLRALELPALERDPAGEHRQDAVRVYKRDASLDRPSNDGAPRIEAQNTAYGFRYAAIRKPLVDPDNEPLHPRHAVRGAVLRDVPGADRAGASCRRSSRSTTRTRCSYFVMYQARRAAHRRAAHRPRQAVGIRSRASTHRRAGPHDPPTARTTGCKIATR